MGKAEATAIPVQSGVLQDVEVGKLEAGQSQVSLLNRGNEGVIIAANRTVLQTPLPALAAKVTVSAFPSSNASYPPTADAGVTLLQKYYNSVGLIGSGRSIPAPVDIQVVLSGEREYHNTLAHVCGYWEENLGNQPGAAKRALDYYREVFVTDEYPMLLSLPGEPHKITQVLKEYENYLVLYERIESSKLLSQEEKNELMGFFPKVYGLGFTGIRGKVGEAGLYPFILMEGLFQTEGWFALRDLPKNLNTLNEFQETRDELRDITAQVVPTKLTRALALMEKLGVYQSDLKPANVMYNPYTMELKLIDLSGLVVCDDDFSIQAKKVALSSFTYAYTAPEKLLLGGQLRQNQGRLDDLEASKYLFKVSQTIVFEAGITILYFLARLYESTGGSSTSTKHPRESAWEKFKTDKTVQEIDAASVSGDNPLVNPKYYSGDLYQRFIESFFVYVDPPVLEAFAKSINFNPHLRQQSMLEFHDSLIGLFGSRKLSY